MKNQLYNYDVLFTDDENFTDVISSFTSEVVPYSKILLISTESDIDILLKIRTSLKKLGHKVVQVVLGDLVEFSLKNACGLFCTPEDVRLAIAIGKRAGKFADYFCKIKGCTSVIVADNYQDYFAPTLFIKTNNGADKIFSNSKKAVIFKKDILPCEVYAGICVLKFNLFDYYACTEFKNLDFDKEKVIDGLFYLKKAQDALKIKDIESAVKQTVCAIERVGELCCCSPIYVVDHIIDCDFSKKLYLANHIITLLSNAFICNTSNIPDYSKIVEQVEKVYSIDQISVLKNIKQQKNDFITPKNIDKFLTSIKNAQTFINNSILEYSFLGGQKISLTETEINAIDISGDTPLGFNIMTIYREYPFC